MNLLRRFVIRAAQELRHNPEARAKASQVLEEQVKPRAEKAWREAQPKINRNEMMLIPNWGNYPGKRVGYIPW